MKIYKVVFKTFDYWGGPIKLVTRILEAYDADHVKQLIQKNDDLILLIEEVEQCRLDNKKEYELPARLTDEERLEVLKIIAKGM